MDTVDGFEIPKNQVSDVAKKNPWQIVGWSKILQHFSTMSLQNRGRYIANPNNALLREIPQNYHTFVLFDSPHFGVPFNDPLTKTLEGSRDFWEENPAL